MIAFSKFNDFLEGNIYLHMLEKDWEQIIKNSRFVNIANVITY